MAQAQQRDFTTLKAVSTETQLEQPKPKGFITYEPVKDECLEKMKSSIQDRGYTFNIKAKTAIATHELPISPKAASNGTLVPVITVQLPTQLLSELDDISAHISDTISKEFHDDEIIHYSRRGNEIPITFARTGIINGPLPLTAPAYGKEYFPYNSDITNVFMNISITISAKRSGQRILVFYTYNVESGTYEKISRRKQIQAAGDNNVCKF